MEAAARESLLALLRHPDPASPRPAPAPEAWPGILALAGMNLRPFVAWRVQSLGLQVPHEAAGVLEASRRSAGILLAQRRAAMRPALAALDAAGIPFVVMKGFALAELAYPSPETRIMGDVDIWLQGPPRSAEEALAPLGWRQPWWRQTNASVGESHAVAVRLKETSLIIELHRLPESLAVLPPDEVALFWQRRQSADLGGITAPVLATAEQLLHLCLHLAQHHRFVAAIPRLLDVAQLVERRGNEIDWSSFAERCREAGVAGWVATALGTARLMMHADISRDALASFGVADLDALCRTAAEQAWLSDRAAVNPGSLFAASGAERTRRLKTRLRDFSFAGEDAGTPFLQRLGRLTRRSWRLLAYVLPTVARAALRGTLRGEAGSQLRRLAAENSRLAEAMREQSQRIRAPRAAGQRPVP